MGKSRQDAAPTKFKSKLMPVCGSGILPRFWFIIMAALLHYLFQEESARWLARGPTVTRYFSSSVTFRA